MSAAFAGVQRLVLHGSKWKLARHLMLDFGDRSPLHFLNQLADQGWPTGALGAKPDLQVSLGFTRRGLERAQVPEHVMSRFALKAPAFWAGAARRAATHLGLTGSSAAEHWDPGFRYTRLDAVLSFHAEDKQALCGAFAAIRAMAGRPRIIGLPQVAELPPPAAPRRPTDAPDPDPRPQWVHFGYRDGLSPVGIIGWTKPTLLQECLPTSRHAAGEFVLGHPNQQGASSWNAGPGRTIWPDEVRAFFQNGSFGVLQQVEQHVGPFEDFVKTHESTELSPDEIKAKLCGRFPDGRPLAEPGQRPTQDFDYRNDPFGYRCPFGSHVRRMNARLPHDDDAEVGRPPPAREDTFLAHFGRSRPLLRRGMPYGPAWWVDQRPAGRGLLGQFFCADIENQFEHLLGEWADRVPLGSRDRGGARDPLIGLHEAGDGPFEIPGEGSLPLQLKDLKSFVQTRGVAYLFYPSLETLHGIARNDFWALDEWDDDE